VAARYGTAFVRHGTLVSSFERARVGTQSPWCPLIRCALQLDRIAIARWWCYRTSLSACASASATVRSRAWARRRLAHNNMPALLKQRALGVCFDSPGVPRENWDDIGPRHALGSSICYLLGER